MLTRSSVFALTAVAALAAAALAPTGASAKPVMGLIIKPHPILGVVIPPKPFPGVVVHPPGGGIVDVDPPRIWWHHQRAPMMVEGDAVRVSTPVATVPPGPCNCLTKNYLTDGSVLFKDLCTKEEAMMERPGGSRRAAEKNDD